MNAASIDTHAHVFHRGLKFIDARRFTPNCDAPLEAYLGHLDSNGIGFGVLIAVSVLGNDNSYLLESLRHEPRRLRGVVAIDPETDLKHFDTFAAAGVVGVRVNLTGAQSIPDFTRGSWAEAVAECARRGWHIEINDRAGRLPRSLGPLTRAGVSVVVDHFGMPDRELGVDDHGFIQLLSYAQSTQVWVKLSGDYRFGPAIADRAAPMLLEAFGRDRLLWGSDWPFTQFEDKQSYAEQRRRLDDWLPNAADRQAVLCDTPRALFKF